MDSGPAPPTAPDPRQTAAAQSKMNRETAITQQGLASTNQITPQGTLSYKIIGTWPDGTPRYEATQALAPGEQSIYDKNLAMRGNLGDIGVSQTEKLGSILNTPFQINPGESVDDRLFSIGRQRLDPMFNERSNALETDLINRGIRPGSTAYDRARTNFDQSRNDAYNNLLLSGRGQALNERQQDISEQIANRNQPFNEIAALLSGTPVGQPNFRTTPAAGVAPTDYIGAVGQKLNADMAAYQAQMQQRNAMMSGLFGLGKTAMMLPFGGWGGNMGGVAGSRFGWG